MSEMSYFNLRVYRYKNFNRECGAGEAQIFCLRDLFKITTFKSIKGNSSLIVDYKFNRLFIHGFALDKK